MLAYNTTSETTLLLSQLISCYLGFFSSLSLFHFPSYFAYLSYHYFYIIILYSYSSSSSFLNHHRSSSPPSPSFFPLFSPLDSSFCHFFSSFSSFYFYHFLLLLLFLFIIFLLFPSPPLRHIRLLVHFGEFVLMDEIQGQKKYSGVIITS